MLALVGTVMLRSASGKVLLRDGDGVLGTHTLRHSLLSYVFGTGVWATAINLVASLSSR
jgi:hypothetical protein